MQAVRLQEVYDLPKVTQIEVQAVWTLELLLLAWGGGGAYTVRSHSEASWMRAGRAWVGSGSKPAA